MKPNNTWFRMQASILTGNQPIDAAIVYSKADNRVTAINRAEAHVLAQWPSISQNRRIRITTVEPATCPKKVTQLRTRAILIDPDKLCFTAAKAATSKEN